jgi:hypothetical protein
MTITHQSSHSNLHSIASLTINCASLSIPLHAKENDKDGKCEI